MTFVYITDEHQSIMRPLSPVPYRADSKEVYHIKYDLVIQNGLVLSPDLNPSPIQTDVAVSGGKIDAVQEHIETGSAMVLDASGLLVTPGLVDFHAHFFRGGTPMGLDPSAYPPTGVTAAVDAGSAGIGSFPLFFETALLAPSVTARAFLNLAPEGLISFPYHEENINPKFFPRQEILDCCKTYREQILGLKIRISEEIAQSSATESLRALEGALSIAEEAGLPLCVHMPGFTGSLEALVSLLRPGDIFCHCYTHRNGILQNGRIAEIVWKARERRVLFDLASSRVHICHTVARQAIAEGFLPDFISGDFTTFTFANPPSYNMPTLISRMVSLGMELGEAIARSTLLPARVMGMEGRIGTLRPGADADIAMFNMDHGPFRFEDIHGDCSTTDLLLRPAATIKSGQLVFRADSERES